jgi:class 3 adenylate cyclase
MSGTAEQIASTLGSLGTLGLSLAIAAVPVVAGIAVYVTRMGFQGRIDRLEGELARLRAQHAEEQRRLQERFDDLDRRHRAVLEAGAVITNTLKQIEDDVAEIAEQVNATEYSVLVPAPTAIPDDRPADQLVFLCISGKQAAALRQVRVPVARSVAGKVFLSNRPSITQKPKAGEGFSASTDRVAGFQTEEILSLPLAGRSGCVGVLQLLNKRGPAPFNADDIDRARNWSGSLARRVADFIEDPRRLAALGHTPRQNRVETTVLFADLSNFAQLFHEMDGSVVTDLVNEYFQSLCDIGLRCGGQVEQFLGDGFMLTFNVNQSIDQHGAAAVAAAWEMRETFRALKERWVTLGYAGTERCFLRIGIESGPAIKAEIGHQQYRRLTVMGSVVNVAAHLCDAGPRDRDVMLIGNRLRTDLGTGVSTRPLGGGRPDEPAFEVLGLG